MADGKSLFNSIVADLDEEIKSSIVNFKGGFFHTFHVNLWKKGGGEFGRTSFWEQQNEIQEVRFLVPKDKRKMEYPFSIPAVQECGEIKFSSPVTIFTGENGSGKSTILEAIAVAAGFNPEGGSKNFTFSTQNTHSQLYEDTQIVRGTHRAKDGYFLGRKLL